MQSPVQRAVSLLLAFTEVRLDKLGLRLGAKGNKQTKKPFGTHAGSSVKEKSVRCIKIMAESRP